MASFLPLAVLTDTYKATHFLQYPKSTKMVAYGEFRCGFNKDARDTRMVVYGIRYVIENYLHRQWTLQDVQQADLFYKTHMTGGQPLAFPKDLFDKFVTENKGYFPVRIEAIPEGTCAHPHVPIYQITAEEEYAPLCTFLETILTMLWYPTTVATLSRRAKDVIARAFEATVEAGTASPLLASRLHDFGFRGCTSVEQSVVGGCAHLLNFEGSDTMSAAYYAQFHLNGGKPVASSIPATEHSVMTSWPTEQAAIENMIQHFGSGPFAVVMDSYNYSKALSEVLPNALAAKQIGQGGFMVLRPDSGDPVEAVLEGLHAAAKVFGTDTNSKGYKVIRGAGVIQGDGIGVDTLRRISEAVQAAGFSAESVGYGMGGGLLQKVNRDTMSFATKLSHIVYADGRAVDVMKRPQTDSGKYSLPGILAVKRVAGVPTVFPADSGEVVSAENLLRVVYDKGPVADLQWETFDELRQRVEREWAALPESAESLSASLRQKVEQLLAVPPGSA